jgi:hypothetical protein
LSYGAQKRGTRILAVVFAERLKRQTPGSNMKTPEPQSPVSGVFHFDGALR